MVITAADPAARERAKVDVDSDAEIHRLGYYSTFDAHMV